MEPGQITNQHYGAGHVEHTVQVARKDPGKEGRLLVGGDIRRKARQERKAPFFLLKLLPISRGVCLRQEKPRTG